MRKFYFKLEEGDWAGGGVGGVACLFQSDVLNVNKRKKRKNKKKSFQKKKKSHSLLLTFIWSVLIGNEVRRFGLILR